MFLSKMLQNHGMLDNANPGDAIRQEVYNTLVARDGWKSLRDRSSYQAFLMELIERSIPFPDVLFVDRCAIV